MKILAVTPAFAPQIGGIEQVVQELSTRLCRMGHQVEVAHVATGHRRYTQDVVAGLTVHRLPLKGHRLVGWAPDLGRLARGFDLLHVHDPQLMALTANVRWSCGQVPAVLSTHGGFRHTQQLSWFKALHERLGLRHMLGHYRMVLASSVADQAYFQAYSDRVVLCSNGVATDKFGSVPIEPDRPLDRWIYWGRLSRNKRVDQLIDTVALARQLGHAVDLLICGRDFDGMAAQLHAQVDRLQLGGQVRFLSYLSDEDLLQELRTRGVYATASEHEGFGLSIVEAMAAGMQILCRDMTPLNTFVEPGQTGRFLCFEDQGRDGRALDALLQTGADGRSAARQQARQQVQVHSWTNAARRFESLMQQVLRQPA
jgi:alpha-1,3-mannosyltransferase